MKLLPRVTALAVAAALAVTPLHGTAIAPILALLAKQMLKDMVTTSLKESLLGSLRDSGCKGTALANAISAGTGGGIGGVASMFTPTGMSGLAAAGKGGMPGLPGGMPQGVTMTAMPGGGSLRMPNTAGMPGGADMAAMMSRMMPAGGMPPGMGLDPTQAASMAKMMTAMNTPLSPAETLSTIDEVADLGLMTPAMPAEMKECMVLMPQGAQAIGMGMSMMKTMLPQVREARDKMRALSPEEQDELAATLAEEFDKMSPEDRKTMLNEAGAGMFPPRVVQSLAQRYGGR